ncbi:aminotransferase class V-fold PLP-dependent enzyme [Paraburkholderia sp. UYCP14C]|uniref:aminotransferase class V-fold PLP-dependent enzyme n=1 Tax=Paraburkholderia sp. UYCP14C TaxID=2511130 RepID=UPI001020EC8F|nr:aminotransferase class V-fold PLP-dependent enzyme [Paraburkholderia sp. UYCP14C]RZF23563.1 aminotransferase class V-fold PLP-dependent enzyme [Paraburkholderia sp. UYCP14C]
MLAGTTCEMNAGVDWAQVREAYPGQHPLLNLNNAAVSPPPLVVEQAVIDAYRFVSKNPDVNMWTGLDATLPDIKRQLATLADCDAEEIALNRNASEGLSVAIFGIALSTDDRVLVSPWDYPSALGGWQQRQAREGIVVDTVAFDVLASDEEIVAAYSSAIRPATRVLHLTHMLHWTGRVLPVARLCALARERGIITIVDAAQSFAQMPISFRELGCDFFVTSLHKWLGAPVGNGMLIVNRRHLRETWPLLAPFDATPDTVDKFDHWNLGTYNSALQAGIEPAIRFHQAIGVGNIHARLRALTRYWTRRAADIDGLRIHTPLEANTLGAVSLFSVDGIDAARLERTLRQSFSVHVKYRRVGQLEGLRVSPHIYMNEADLDVFMDALHAAVKDVT